MRIKYKVVDKIIESKYPMDSPRYPSAHRGADNQEKKDYPVGYQRMKSIDAKLPNGEYAGTHSKSGSIEVSRKVPEQYRNEVADHEYYEHMLDPGKCAVCKNSRDNH